MTISPLNKTRLAVGLTALLMAAGAQATGFSRSIYNSAKDDIKAAYKVEREACTSQSGNAKDICIESAKGREKVALARLQYDYSGNAKDNQKWMTARYEARFEVAKEKCDDLAGDAKSLCLREAMTVRDKAKADVKLAKQVSEAVDSAESARLAADYKLAKERCDSLAGAAKDACMASARARYPA